MKSIPLYRTLLLVLTCLALSGGCSDRHVIQHSSVSVHDQDRIAGIRKSTVRILVEGKPKGSGFVIAEDGLIATAFHVVAKTVMHPHGKPQITFASPIEIQFEDGERLPALAHASCLGTGMYRAILCDFAILEVSTTRKLIPLRIGSFRDIREGSYVYLAGFPLTSEQPRVTVGRVKVKWDDPIGAPSGQSSSGRRKTAGIGILDIGMSRGDSGGPIVLIGETSANDRVVGIASFIMHPLDQELKTLMKAIQSHTRGRDDAVCSLELFSLLRKEYGSQSLFLAGYVSVEPVKARLQKFLETSRDAKERRTMGFTPFDPLL